MENSQLKDLKKDSKEIIRSNTKPIKFEDDPEKRLWVDVSIEIQSLRPMDIATECNKRSNRAIESWRQEYYRWKLQGFNDWWYEQYKDYHKKRGTAKVYGKLDKLLDNSRFIKDVVQAGEFLEGKQSGINVQTNVMVMPSELIEKYDIAQNTKSGSEERP